MASIEQQPQREIPSESVFGVSDYYNVSDRPVLANGHIGYVPYSDSIYMNGVYNGFKGSSHRARIPNYANIYADHCGPSQEPQAQCLYALDVQQAIFTMDASLDGGNILVRQRQYAHRYYDAVIVNSIQLERNSENLSGEWILKYTHT